MRGTWSTGKGRPTKRTARLDKRTTRSLTERTLTLHGAQRIGVGGDPTGAPLRETARAWQQETASTLALPETVHGAQAKVRKVTMTLHKLLASAKTPAERARVLFLARILGVKI